MPPLSLGGRIDARICPECYALHWEGEQLCSSTKRLLRYGVCCDQGDKLLAPLQSPPEPLKHLLESQDPQCIKFRRNIRQYNLMFAFTSVGLHMDTRKFGGSSWKSFQIHGALHHNIGILDIPEGRPASYAQLYIYDSQHTTDVRMIRNTLLDKEIAYRLERMLRQSNPFPALFQYAYEILRDEERSGVPL